MPDTPKSCILNVRGDLDCESSSWVETEHPISLASKLGSFSHDTFRMLRDKRRSSNPDMHQSTRQCNHRSTINAYIGHSNERSRALSCSNCVVPPAGTYCWTAQQLWTCMARRSTNSSRSFPMQKERAVVFQVWYALMKHD